MGRHFNAVLVHTCTVQRPSESRTESGDIEVTYSTTSSLVPCRLIQKMERFAAEGLSAENIRTDILLTKTTADIEVGDRVTSFAWLLDGTAYDVGTYTVLNRLQRNVRSAHHLSFELEQVVS